MIFPSSVTRHHKVGKTSGASTRNAQLRAVLRTNTADGHKIGLYVARSTMLTSLGG
ncbi:hypothetical protein QFZ23_002417 [Arthrobacter globiformis]|uniref:hypothetical protein n=1 Tax=Arthrobacter globiformis TaxID=1665 RepID=UPI002787B7C6|nr:hypothetical protein [Arthrobacter globiformis]MDQ1058516.1 hypothetical protein [Arthrobacter globiformis]